MVNELAGLVLSSTGEVLSVVRPQIHFDDSLRPYGFNAPYREYFRRFEEIMTRYQGRPHWAKAHALQPDELRRLYPKFDDFVQIVGKSDPSGTFHNEYIERHILGRPISRRVFKLRP